MKDELITYSTAKLAKEKGFNIRTHYVWINRPGEPKCRKVDITLDLLDNEYNAPTQSLLQRWLREKHNCFVEVRWYCEQGQMPDDLNWGFYVDYYGIPYTNAPDASGSNFNSYEEALEAGLQEALKLIKS